MTRILFLTTSMGTGGVGNQLYNISMRLQQHSYDIKILSIRPLGRFGEKAVKDGIDAESLGLENKIEVPVALYRVRRIIKSFRPDIIHTNMFHATIVGRIASICTETAVISTVHTTYEEDSEKYETSVRDYLYKFTDSQSDLTTFVGNKAKERYVKKKIIPEKKAKTVHNGVNTDKYKRKNNIDDDRESFKWVIVANLLAHKGHKVLLKAMKYLAGRGYDLKLAIIGGGPLEEKLRRNASGLRLNDFVSFKGRVSPNEVPTYLNSADAFVSSSLREGFGLVVAEAMACELPVVATNVGGPSEIIEHGETGFLAQRGSAKDLAQKMENLMELSPEERSRIGSRARERIESNYSIEQTVSDWESIYQEYN